MEKAKKSRFLYYFLRVLSICAVVCTIGLTAFLCWNSLKSGDESSQISSGVSDTLKEDLNLKDNDIYVPLTAIESPMNNDAFFTGTTMPLDIKFSPENATNKQLTYLAKSPKIIDVDDEGNLYFHSYGRADVIVTSVENPEISITVNLFSSGIEAEYLQDTYPTFSDDTGVVSPTYTLEEGTVTYLNIRTPENDILSVLSMETVILDESIIQINSVRRIIALKEGTTDITVISNKTGDSKTFTLTVTDNPDFIAPESYVFKQETVEIYLGEEYYPETNIASINPTNASSDIMLIEIDRENEEVLAKRTGYFVALAPGESIINVRSRASNINSTFTVKVIEKTPTTLTVLGKDRITQEENSYRVFADDNYAFALKWEILSGKATIDQNGTLTPKGLGNVKIRATSLLDPEITADFEITVSLFHNLGYFVRKFIGHFSAFAVLGLGFSVSFYLLSKRKKVYFPLALMCSFIVAAVTEILQLPIFVQGRGPAIGDVFIDFTGSFIGILAVTLLYWLITLMVRICSKKAYKTLKSEIEGMNVKSVFKAKP